MHLKKTYQIGEFLCSHFNIEDGKNMQGFQHIMLYYFKELKNTPEMQKKKKKKVCAVYGEGAVTDCVKSGL